MSKFTSAQLEANLNRLRRLADTQKNGKPFLLPEGAVSRLDLIERRLVEAVRRDDSGTVERDGFGSGRPGSGGEDAGSSVESAALSGFKLDRPADVDTSTGQWMTSASSDPHHALTASALDALERAAQAVALLMLKLDAIDALTNMSRPDPAGHCMCCARWVEGTPNDRLRAGYCPACYQAWLREGRPDRVHFERRRRQEAA